MKKYTIILFTLFVATLAYGCATPQATPEPASLPQEASAPPQVSVPVAPPEALLEPSTGETPIDPVMNPEIKPSAIGLRVVYLRAGNLWSWTEASGAVQLTNTGDMSSISVSKDGQLLAFMRGQEVWTVRMDGADSHLVDTQESAGGALWFAPNGSLLAISTRDHVDVIDLSTVGKTLVLSYPSIPTEYYPEVIWTPDSMGFKTLIPGPLDNAQAELMFVFTDGTVASLAKFPMLSTDESPPYLSPDGGYVIYVAKLEDGRESLFLMDSSGATRPYGEPAVSVRAKGWLPDSKHFAFGWEEPLQNFLGDIGGLPVDTAVELPATTRWVNGNQYFAIQNGNLILGELNGAKMPIDAGISEFDIVLVN